MPSTVNYSQLSEKATNVITITPPPDSSSSASATYNIGSESTPDPDDSFGEKSTLDLLKPSYGSFSSKLSRSSELQDVSIGRAFSKKGFSNISPANLDTKDWPFYRDIFTTLLDVKWRWLLFAFCLMYFMSWLIFALIWYGILRIHGDFLEQNLPSNLSSTHVPCITNMRDFTSVFLFSVETQHTTGYGFYHLTEECPIAIVTFCAQSIVGVIIEGLMVGLVFVKMARSKKRSATLLFSKNAVITLRDGQLCFLFRVADMRQKSHLLEARVRAQLVGRRVTMEGEEVSIAPQELEVSGDGERENQVLLFWPTTIIHKINSSSPLFKITPDDLVQENTSFEIIVVLEGIVETTGLVTQARSSYLPSEILWGHRFKNIAPAIKSERGDRIIDYSLFHETIPVSTPNTSAFHFEKSQKKQ